MKTWVPVDFNIAAGPVTIDDADATLEINLVWDCGSTDADGRQASAAGYILDGYSLASINLGGKERSREWLVDLCGEEAVAQGEEWASEALNLSQIADNMAANYAAE